MILVDRRFVILGILGLEFACGRPAKQDRTDGTLPPTSAVSAVSAPASDAARLVEPTRLIELPISAYSASLASDDDAVYLLTASAAYRLVPGEPGRRLELELGVGAVLTPSAFIFWSRDAIWRAPKTGGVTRPIAKLSPQPQYFAASGEDVAWVTLSGDGIYSIQTLQGDKPRVLVSSRGELSALNRIGSAIYFVHRPTADTWRIGRVEASGGAPHYAPDKRGRRPSMLSFADQLYYYDVDSSEIRSLSLDLRHEETRTRKLVCSPISVASAIYCGCVEGLFQVSKQSHEPRVLVHGRPGSITNIVADSRRVAWIADIGAEKLAVDLLPAPSPR